MGSLLSRAVCEMVRLMTEIELNKRIETLLTERPIQPKSTPASIYSRQEIKVRKDDRLLKIMNYGGYAPHVGYVDWGFDGRTLLHTGKYIKYPKNSNCQRWMKRLTSKKTRRNSELTGKGNQYRRLFDSWWTLY